MTNKQGKKQSINNQILCIEHKGQQQEKYHKNEGGQHSDV